MAQKIKVLGQIRYLKILQAPRFKKAFTTSDPFPWDKTRDYIYGARPGQLEVWNKFAEIAHKTKGLPLHERMRIIAQEMSGYRAPHRMPEIPRAMPEEVFQNRMRQREEVLRKKLAQLGY
jgi:hypothetical protein